MTTAPQPTQSSGLRAGFERLARRLLSPVDIAPLVWFRILFGLLMVWEIRRYLANDWVSRYYIEPAMHFKYFGFHWVKALPGDLMYLHLGLMYVLAVLITLGLFYRPAAALFSLGYCYIFLLDSARYLNHAYLICLISFIMIFIPAHRAGSLDALLRPRLRSQVAPAWALWWLRIQIGIVYTYAAIAKLNPDWLRGEPIRMWLARRTDVPLIGTWFTEEWMVYLHAYGGLLIDLLIFPALLWRRTMPYALVIGVVFHLMNYQLFTIGVFPWFMIATMVLFLPNSWLRFGGRWVADRARSVRESVAAIEPPRIKPVHMLSLALIGVYLTWQLLFPLRHHVYPDNVAWNEEGHRFSWRMMLRSKTGRAEFHVHNPVTGEGWVVRPQEHLMNYQASKVPTHPDMILQFSHNLARMFRDEGHEEVVVRADVRVSLNGRPPVRFVDPEANLAVKRNTLRTTTWVTRDAVEPLRSLTE